MNHAMSQIVCPACSERFPESESVAYEGQSCDDDVAECPSCGWEFWSDEEPPDDDGDIEGEAELEVDADGDIVDPEDADSFPPWHGLVSVANEGRGWHDIGMRDESRDYEDFDPFPEKIAIHRAVCPSCAHSFRDVGQMQIVCPDCHFSFSLDCEAWREEREYDDDYDEGYRLDDSGLEAAFLPPIIVCPRGSGHVRSVPEALARAGDNGTILLRPGCYPSWGVMDCAVQIIGEGQRDEIIVYIEREPLSLHHPQALLSNLTLRGLGRSGKRKHPAVDLHAGIVEDCAISSESVVGVRMEGGTLRRCRIHDCEQVGILSGGGVIEDCEVTHCAETGIAINEHAAEVVRCQIHHNQAAGVQIGPQGSGWLLDLHVHNNADHGVAIAGWRALLLRCAIHDNGSAGVFVESSGSAKLRRCDVFGNIRSGLHNQGGGLYVFGSRIRDGQDAGIVVRDTAVTYLRRCTICRNRLGALARSRRSSKPIVRNCRVFSNGLSIVRERKLPDIDTK